MAGILGGIIGNVIGNTISGAINAAQNAANKKPGGSSSGSSSSSSRPSGGSASNVGVYDDWQQSIKDQMNSNSQAWWDAKNRGDQAEMDRLHQENIKLSGQLGSGVSYDGSTGKWSGSADAPSMPEFPQYTPTDNSEYLEEMAAAYLEKQKEALKQAYEQNLSNLQAEQDKLGANYQAARNQEAADSALSQKRWNETAAAYGLNSGTQGQAALSYSNQLQSDLSSLQAAESAANAEIERQRTDLGKEYQSAMTQAIADNNYQLYEKLYQEAVRVDQALQNQSQFNAQMALQKYQTMLDKYYNDQSFQYNQSQANRSEQFDAAALAAQMGDYSLYGKLYGWDDNYVQQMENAWKAANTPTYSSGGRGSGGSGSGYTGNDSDGTDIYDPSNDAYESGVRTYSQALAYFKKLGYSDSIAKSLAEEYISEYDSGNYDVDMEKVNQIYNNIIEMRDTSLNRNDPDFAGSAIIQYAKQESLGLNQKEVEKLLTMFGYNPSDWI